VILAVETATERLSVALLDGERVLAERSGSAGRVHSETLLPAIDAVLAEAGIELANVRAFALAVGPGSFTGLRIAVATVKGLGFGGSACALPVSTLAALAEGSGALARGPVLALLDARRGEAYAGLYAADDAVLLEDTVLRPEALAPRLPERGAIAVGEGAGPLAAAIVRERPGWALLPAPAGEPSARAVARIGARQLARGESVSIAELIPRYLRRAEAEARRTGQPLEPVP